MVKEMRSLRRQGITLLKIAEKMSVSESTVHRHLVGKVKAPRVTRHPPRPVKERKSLSIGISEDAYRYVRDLCKIRNLTQSQMLDLIVENHRRSNSSFLSRLFGKAA